MSDKTEQTAAGIDLSKILGGEGLSICGSTSEELQTCLAYAYQRASVCVPVEVIPFAESGDIKTYCCGEPIIKSYKDKCSGKCKFTITQCICVEVPVAFGADAFVGDPHVRCEMPSDEDICTDCDSITEPSKPTFCPPKKKVKIYF